MSGIEICDKDTWIPVPHGGIRPLIDALRAECIERYPIVKDD